MANRQLHFLFCSLWCALFFAVDVNGQDSSFQVVLPLYVHASFFYDFPQSIGAAAGIDFPLKSKRISLITKNGKEKKVKFHDLITNSDFGFYRYPFNSTGLYFFQSIGYRYDQQKPYYFEWLANAGVLRTFYDGTVYAVDNYGNVSTLKNFGRYYATLGFTAVFGHNWEKSKIPKPFAIDIKPSLWVQYPYNSFILPHLSLMATFSYHFTSFHINVKQTAVTRAYNK